MKDNIEIVLNWTYQMLSIPFLNNKNIVKKKMSFWTTAWCVAFLHTYSEATKTEDNFKPTREKWKLRWKAQKQKGVKHQKSATFYQLSLFLFQMQDFLKVLTDIGI